MSLSSENLELERHRCAVRQLCKWRNEWGLQKFRTYLQKYTWNQKLLDDFYKQFKLGNKGEYKCWKEQSLLQQALDI